MPINDIIEVRPPPKPLPESKYYGFEKARVIVEPSASMATAQLFGAGHVALPTARLAPMAGFQV
jgi:hypothetical protein